MVLALWFATLLVHLAGAAEPLPAKAAGLLKDVHRIVFLGDSITQGGDYVVDTDCWLLRHGVTAEVLNLGLGSETATDLTAQENDGHAQKHGFGRPFVSERLDRALAATKPDLLFVCYGMNDGGALPSDDSGTQRFGEAMVRLRERALKAGVKRVVICTPPVHDNKKDAASDPADQNLARYTAWLLSKRNEGWLVVDIHTPMRAALDQARATQADFVFAKDGVHPGREGHWLMARQILEQAFGANVAGISSAEALFAERGAEIRKLAKERATVLWAAWMTQIGHKRPSVPGGPNSKPGISVSDAQAKASGIADQIQRALQP